MKITDQQLESIKSFLETIYEVTSYKEILTNEPNLKYYKYLSGVANEGIKKYVKDGFDLKYMIEDILRFDNVLIPVNVLKQLANID